MPVDLAFRPLDRATWIDDGRRNYRRCPFRATYGKTLSQLRYELEKLRAGLVVIELDFEPDELRLDGLPYASARPNTPRVRVSFDAPEIGAQCYMCDTYPTWQENLRGIVMTLDRLRAVERYGATRGKQQYRGWAGLPAKATDGFSFSSRQEAAAFLSRLSGVAERDCLTEAGMASAYRIAAAAHHPDKGGSDDMMAKINAARAKLNGRQ